MSTKIQDQTTPTAGNLREALTDPQAIVRIGERVYAVSPDVFREIAALREALERALAIDSPNSRPKWTRIERIRSLKAWREQARAALGKATP